MGRWAIAETATMKLRANWWVLDGLRTHRYRLHTNYHSHRLARAESAGVVVDLGPDADLAGDRIDFRADERHVAVERGVALAGQVERESHRRAEQVRRPRRRPAESLRP